MTRVPNGILGHASNPASALWCWAAARYAKPRQVVGRRQPDRRYLALRFSIPTADSAEAFALGSYPAVDVFVDGMVRAVCLELLIGELGALV